MKAFAPRQALVTHKEPWVGKPLDVFIFIFEYTHIWYVCIYEMYIYIYIACIYIYITYDLYLLTKIDAISTIW